MAKRCAIFLVLIFRRASYPSSPEIIILLVTTVFLQAFEQCLMLCRTHTAIAKNTSATAIAEVIILPKYASQSICDNV